MESDVTQSAFFYKAWAWAETHQKHLLVALLFVVVMGLAAGTFLWYQSERENDANAALSRLTVADPSSPEAGSPEAFLKVASDYPNTRAAERATLLAAAAQYERGNYAAAKTEFERFIREFRNSPFTGDALMGIAASLDAMGNTEEAIRAYNDIVTRRAREYAGFQAQLALGRLYEAAGQLEQARNAYETVARGATGTSLSSEAAMAYQDLLTRHPELVPSEPPSAAPSGLPGMMPAEGEVVVDPGTDPGALNAAETNSPVLNSTNQ